MHELTVGEVEDVSGGLVITAGVLLGAAALFATSVALGMTISAADGGSCEA